MCKVLNFTVYVSSSIFLLVLLQKLIPSLFLWMYGGCKTYKFVRPTHPNAIELPSFASTLITFILSISRSTNLT